MNIASRMSCVKPKFPDKRVAQNLSSPAVNFLDILAGMKIPAATNSLLVQSEAMATLNFTGLKRDIY